MLKIRLQRTGKRGQAYFRIVLVEHTKKPKGKVQELLGNYNPHEKEFKISRERVEYWMSNGAQISPTVNNLMVNFKIWDKPKMQSWKPKKKAAAEAAAPAKASKEEAVPVAETPAPESQPAPTEEAPAGEPAAS